jgi:alkanesulfonate monooxygenase SsuD/methylene tetrahydromethanopterin reductase-like flavin-dependent oxidoreductase (luciferase family)
VSLVPAAATEGGLRATHLSLDSLKQKSALVRAAAGTRSRDPEINILIFDVVISGDRRAAATSYLHDIEARLEGFVVDGELTVDQLLDSPHVLFGTHEQIAEHVIGVRERASASYISVFPHCMDDFAPVLTRLREPWAAARPRRPLPTPPASLGRPPTTELSGWWRRRCLVSRHS